MTMRRLFEFKYVQIAVISIIITMFFVAAAASAQEHPYTGDGTLRRLHTPVLMYHYVSELPPDADELRVRLTLSPNDFRQHIQYLKTQGYVSVSLYEIYRALYWGDSLPANPVALTFDDGHLDHYTHVMPVLQEAGFIGTFFVITQFADANREHYLNWRQIQTMAAAGMQIESHTKTHPDLTNRDYDYLVYQILGSVESNARHTGIAPQIFSYPAGRYDQAVLSVLRTTPIVGAVTTRHGAIHTTTSALEMPRLRITNETTATALAYLLRTDRP